MLDRQEENGTSLIVASWRSVIRDVACARPAWNRVIKGYDEQNSDDLGEEPVDLLAVQGDEVNSGGRQTSESCQNVAAGLAVAAHAPGPDVQSGVAVTAPRERNSRTRSGFDGEGSKSHRGARRPMGWLTGAGLVLLLTACVGVFGPLKSSPTNDVTQPVAGPQIPAQTAIEEIRVGQRVLVDSPEAAAGETAVDPDSWRRIRMRAVHRWDDGTLDTVEIDTLQPQQWIEAHGVAVGGDAPIPLDLVEMGLPEEMTAQVQSIGPCPPIQSGPGRVVLTTVNHLNADVWELTLADAAGEQTAIRPTGLHKFYSEDRNKWVTTKELLGDETLRALDGILRVVSTRALPGPHTVYNMTVEGEHVYHVSPLGLLAHNTCRVVQLDPRLGKKPVGPRLGRDDSISAGLSGEDLIAGSMREAEDISTAIGGGQHPIFHADQFGEHFHPTGGAPDIHIWWE